LCDVDDINTLLNKNKTFLRFYKKIFKSVDCYFSINQIFSSQYIEALGLNKNLLELPQGVDTSVFSPVKNKTALRKTLHLPSDSYLIVSIGFLINRKGFEELFHLIAKLSFNLHLIILGEFRIDQNHFLSNHKMEMEKLYEIGKKKLGDKVKFLGFKKDIEHYLKCADVFLLNSIQEGLPNVLLEAMACEIPVITRKIPGVDGFLTSHMKNSLVAKNPNEIISQLEYLHSNIEISKRLARYGMKDVIKNYSFEKVYNTLLTKLNV
jgi:glycosyltransferase involved in cell wall biosynthesis